jgi:hypothetical protein
LLLVLASVVIIRSESRGTHDQILLSQIRESPNLEGQVPILIFPRNRVARLHTQALDSLFIASYDVQGYGGGIRPRLHIGVTREVHLNVYKPSSYLRGNTLSITKANLLMRLRKIIAFVLMIN